ncbi:MAG: TonB-dependent receptor [Blastomonas sp.]|nr:TonB-dependent receptor [Blastomonas sp.]
MKRTLMAGSTLAAVLAAAPAHAQQEQPEPDTFVEENTIIVTAQRREQSLSEVPLAVSVFSGTFLEKSRTETVADLVAFSPGVSGTSVAQTTPRIAVRGISTEDFGVGSDPALGIYIDDVYLGRGVSSVADLFDVRQVEIVKGPQGTLFGRNTTAGAISITTAKPVSTFEGSGEIAYGRFDEVVARGVVNLPIIEDVALRVAGSSRTRDGFVRNTQSGRIGAIDSQAIRASLGYDGATTTMLASFEYRNTRNEPGPYINPVLVGTDPFGPISSNLVCGLLLAPHDFIDSYRATLRIEHEFAGGTTLTAITAYNGFDNSYLEDTDASPFSLLEFGTKGVQDSYSQELRLTGEAGRLTWAFGAIAARDVARSTQFAQFSEEDFCAILFASDCTTAIGAQGDPLVTERSEARSRNTSFGVFGDFTFKATERLDLIAGLRFSHDRKNFTVRLPRNDNLLGPVIIVPPSDEELAALGTVSPDGTLRQTYRDSGWQPRFALNYRVSDVISAYASVTRGYKAGGFNQLNPGPAFRPEAVWSYEIGVKGDLPDQRITFDLAAYRFDYSDLQALVDFAGSVVTRNAGTATGEGIEGSVIWRPSNGLTLSAGAAWQDIRYGRFVAGPGQDFSGNRLVRSPEFTANFIADVDTPIFADLRLLARGEFSYQSSQFFRPSNDRFTRQEGFALLGGSFGVGIGDDWEVRAFASNLLGERYMVDAAITVPDLLLYTQRGEPRIIGVQTLLRF